MTKVVGKKQERIARRQVDKCAGREPLSIEHICEARSGGGATLDASQTRKKVLRWPHKPLQSLLISSILFTEGVGKVYLAHPYMLCLANATLTLPVEPREAEAV